VLCSVVLCITLYTCILRVSIHNPIKIVSSYSIHVSALLFLTAIRLGNAFIINNEVCPAEAPCRCYGTKVDCVAKHMTTMPNFTFTRPASGVSHRELTIDLQKNQLTNIPARAFPDINEASFSRIFIFFQENRIRSIDNDAFLGFGNSSVEINLSDNSLNSLPRALNNIGNLQSLWLTGNPIAYLDNAIMTHIGRTLKTLYLDMSVLAIWPHAMDYLIELTDLHAIGIPFSNLPDNAFDKMVKLERLEIAYSKLHQIPTSICQLASLEHFEFHHNDHIPNSATQLISCQNPLQHVLYVGLNNNDLSFFPPNVLRVFTNTRTLDLSYNRISSIPDSLVPGSNQLYYFYISHNAFTQLPSVVSKMGELLNIVANGNPINSIDGSTLSHLNKLNQVTLNDVPLTYLDPHAFSTSYVLRNLYLERTNLTSVPAAIMHSADRFTVFMTGSHVECTCTNLAFIREWPVTDFSSYKKRVNGQCVNINSSIQNFIIGLPGNCP